MTFPAIPNSAKENASSPKMISTLVAGTFMKGVNNVIILAKILPHRVTPGGRGFRAIQLNNLLAGYFLV